MILHPYVKPVAGPEHSYHEHDDIRSGTAHPRSTRARTLQKGMLGRVLTANVAVGRNADERLTVFARGTESALRHIWQPPLAVVAWIE